MKVYKKLADTVDIATEILFYHTNLKGLAFLADSILSKEYTNSLHFNENE